MMDDTTGARTEEAPSGALSENEYLVQRFEQATRTLRLRGLGTRPVKTAFKPVARAASAMERVEPATKAPAAAPARHPRAAAASASSAV